MQRANFIRRVRDVMSTRETARARPRRPDSKKRAPVQSWLPRASKRASGRRAAPLVPAHIRVLGVELEPDDRMYIRRKLGMKLDIDRAHQRPRGRRERAPGRRRSGVPNQGRPHRASARGVRGTGRLPRGRHRRRPHRGRARRPAERAAPAHEAHPTPDRPTLVRNGCPAESRVNASYSLCPADAPPRRVR